MRRILHFFSPKTGHFKKKRSSPKLRRIFRPKSEIQPVFQPESRHLLHNFGTQFPLGGAVFIFSPKIGLKNTKNVRFCILYRPMGGTRAPPPPPPLATLLALTVDYSTGLTLDAKVILFRFSKLYQNRKSVLNKALLWLP